MSLLLENGADVELPDNYGQSPLFMACWKGGLIVGSRACTGLVWIVGYLGFVFKTNN